MARRKRGDAVHGWVVLDKPVGMTSTQAVGAVRALFNAQKAGHAGTLDPLASGLLPIALGEATKTVPFAMDGAKAYEATVRWGEQTNTDDAEGSIVAESSARPDAQSIKTVLKQFEGEILQVPPEYSAIKVGGERAYKLARKGKDFQLPARKVQIDAIRLVAMPDADHAVLHVACGKGTYIRSLARDIGRELGCFGHIAALRRTIVKPFATSDMIMLEKLRELGHKGADRSGLMACLVPIDAALDDIPAVSVEKSQARDLSMGRPVLLRGRDAPVKIDTAYATCRGMPVSICSVENGMLKPKRVFKL